MSDMSNELYRLFDFQKFENEETLNESITDYDYKRACYKKENLVSPRRIQLDQQQRSPIITRDQIEVNRTPVTDEEKAGVTNIPCIDQPEAWFVRTPVTDEQETDAIRKPLTFQQEAWIVKTPVTGEQETDANVKPLTIQPEAWIARTPVTDEQEYKPTKMQFVDQQGAKYRRTPVTDEQETDATVKPLTYQQESWVTRTPVTDEQETDANVKPLTIQPESWVTRTPVTDEQETDIAKHHDIDKNIKHFDGQPRKVTKLDDVDLEMVNAAGDPGQDPNKLIFINNPVDIIGNLFDPLIPGIRRITPTNDDDAD